MSLLSTDITKLRRPSLRDVKLPASQPREEPPDAAPPPPSAEDIAYSKLVAVNPLVDLLVDRFRLVSHTTGKSFKRVDLPEEAATAPAPATPESKPEEIDAARLIALAQRVIEGENSYTREEIVERIGEATGVIRERAERGFNLMLQAGAIVPTLRDRYYLAGSTPF